MYLPLQISFTVLANFCLSCRIFTKIKTEGPKHKSTVHNACLTELLKWYLQKAARSGQAGK